MAERLMRIEKICIENFKNIQQGILDLENKRKNFRSSIVGLYGQNGSGKTALIDAIQILKHSLCGQSIPDKYADYINVDSEYSLLEFQFKMEIEKEHYDIWYQLCLRKIEDNTSVNMEEDKTDIKYKVEVFDEVLEYAYSSSSEKIRKGVLINTKTDEVFIPKSKYIEFFGNNKANFTDMLVTKRLVQTQSKSFIFSRQMINAFRRSCNNERYMNVIEGLVLFGNRKLFIIDTEKSGLISLDTLPLAFRYKDGKSETVGNLVLPLNKPVPIPEIASDLIKKVIDNLNIVLKELVPGLTIGIIDLGPTVFQDGKAGRLIQLLSLKNRQAIPFQYESEGIKKIVSVLQLLIVVYNNPSITVAIDELDAGVFEYLLGEFLKLISEKGKGQLIFTSHNLRPLETIDRGFIAFTTTNPENRYIRMVNVKDNNNLRDFYYRDIVLGEQDEQLYSPTNNYEIALALREAGEAFGS